MQLLLKLGPQLRRDHAASHLPRAVELGLSHPAIPLGLQPTSPERPRQLLHLALPQSQLPGHTLVRTPEAWNTWGQRLQWSWPLGIQSRDCHQPIVDRSGWLPRKKPYELGTRHQLSRVFRHLDRRLRP